MEKRSKDRATHCGYGAGHPWYYVLDGDPLRPRQILEEVRASGYRGYRGDELNEIDARPEPKRSHALRAMREQVQSECRKNLHAYRRCVRVYRAHSWRECEKRICADVHVSISLKHNHLYNDFAHLVALDDLLSRQADLFD